MPLVHAFPTVTSLADGFRIPFQYLGTGVDPAAKAIPDSVLLDWIIENIGLTTASQTVTTGGTIAVAAGSLIQAISIKAATGARTVKIGTSSGADDILGESDIDSATDFTAQLYRYTSSAITLHFTLTGGSAAVLVFSKSAS
jgi:hypothetical protein